MRRAHSPVAERASGLINSSESGCSSDKRQRSTKPLQDFLSEQPQQMLPVGVVIKNVLLLAASHGGLKRALGYSRRSWRAMNPEPRCRESAKLSNDSRLFWFHSTGRHLHLTRINCPVLPRSPHNSLTCILFPSNERTGSPSIF